MALTEFSETLMRHKKPYWSHDHKFGYSDAVATTEITVWDGDVIYPWPAAAAATTIVSDDTKDDIGGVGALTVSVEGLDANWAEVTETVSMDGTTPVALANEYIRVNRATVLTAGSENDNAGTIDIKHSSTVIAAISPGENQTLMAVRSVPAGKVGYLTKLYLSAGKAEEHTMRLKSRPFGGVFSTKHIEITTASGLIVDFDIGTDFSAKSDIHVTTVKTTGNNGVASASWDMIFVDEVSARN